MDAYQRLDFTTTFLPTYASGDFSAADRARCLSALRPLATDERHPSPWVHELAGELAGVWSALASDMLRMAVERAAPRM